MPAFGCNSALRVVTLALLLAWGAALVVITLVLDAEAHELFFSEKGPIERLSIVLWVLLAGLALAVLRPTTPAVVAGALLALFSAAREASWHTRFTGYSVLKIGFYHDAEFPITHRLIAAAAVGFMTGCIFVLVRRLIQLLKGVRGGLPDWAWLAAVGLIGIAATKVLDRSGKLFEDHFGYELPEDLLELMRALEEGFEMALPLLFGAAVVGFARGSRRAKGDEAAPASDGA